MTRQKVKNTDTTEKADHPKKATVKKATVKNEKTGGSHPGKDDKIADELNEKLNEAEMKNKELQDKYLRLSAEFDNYRKRTLREKMELTKSAGEQLLLNMLPVIDDFERGMKTIDLATEIQGVKEGMMLIYNKFKDFLGQNGVKEIEALHNAFDLELHEAITKVASPSEELKGKVVDVIEKGYILNDKVMRYSKVVVGE